MLNTLLVCLFAGLGAGLGTGFAGMSAAAVISPMLITFLGLPAYQAVGIALASDVLASAVSAWTYGKNKNLDVKNGVVMMASVLAFTLVGRYVSSLVPNTAMGGFICGFIGAGGGMMMLLILTSVLGYELKTAVGTSVFIMTFTAFTGAVSHFAIGGAPDWGILALCVLSTLLFAQLAARFANKASPVVLNRATGVVLAVLGAVMIGVNYL